MVDIFGNHAMIKHSPETEQAGLSYKVGVVFGESIPSSSGVTVIGTSKEDYAIHVHFDDLGEGYWFAPELIKMIDDGQGTRVTLGEGENKIDIIKGPKGQWFDKKTGGNMPPPMMIHRKKKSAWWKFWK